MAALTQNAKVGTSFEGKQKVIVLDLDMATGTTGTVTLSELTEIQGVVGQLKEAPTAAAAHVWAAPNATTATNVLKVVLYGSDHVTANTQTATDVVLFVIGY